MTNVRSVVQLLRKEHDRLTRQIKGIGAALEAFGATYGMKGTRKISPAGRARIAAAQRARWAKVHDKGTPQVTRPKKRTVSAAAKKKIAEAQKKRWAKLKAKQKETS